MVAFASSLDQAGPIAKTVEDSAILLDVMCSHDPKDSTSLKVEQPDWRADVSKGVKGMRIGIPKEYRMDGMSEEIDALWNQGIEWLKAAGAEIVDISLPHTKYAFLPITSWRRQRPRRTSPAMTACAMARVSTETT
jgi:aspartyl-tRNA(Asn)/glutamyl-tRNA(Gln) amidotransferase subunit A